MGSFQQNSPSPECRISLEYRCQKSHGTSQYGLQVICMEFHSCRGLAAVIGGRLATKSRLPQSRWKTTVSSATMHRRLTEATIELPEDNSKSRDCKGKELQSIFHKPVTGHRVTPFADGTGKNLQPPKPLDCRSFCITLDRRSFCNILWSLADVQHVRFLISFFE